jgi:hypothetical protein
MYAGRWQAAKATRKEGSKERKKEKGIHTNREKKE